MADIPNRYEDLIGRLAEDPAFSGVAKPHSGILVWSADAKSILWTSPSARALGAALSDEAGHVLPSLKASDRLKALASGLAPRQGLRLERLWLNPARLASPVTCACRLASIGQESVLVTVIVGPVPKIAPRPRQKPSRIEDAGTPEVSQASPKATATGVLPAGTEDKPRDTVRFLWQMDAETRFVQVSPELAEAVGPQASDILGRTWEEVSRSVVEDPDGTVASQLARRQTWSGQTLLWAVDNSRFRLPVDWAGMPIHGPNREFIGFRGFGLLRMDAIRTRSGEQDATETTAHGEEAPGPATSAAEQAEPGMSARTPPAAPAPEGNWFKDLRERVAASLSHSVESSATAGGAGAASPSGEPKPAVDGPKAGKAQAPGSSLSSVERNAFREIARALGARIDIDHASVDTASVEAQEPASAAKDNAVQTGTPASVGETRVLDGLPAGILVHQGERILFANRVLLDVVGYDDVGQITAEGGLARLFRESPALLRGEDDSGSEPVALTNRRGESLAVEVRLSETEWNGAPATLMLIRPLAEPEAPQRLRAAEADLQASEARVRELEAILDTATDGVIALDETGRILALNRSAEALFGYDQREVVGDAITVLLAPESHIVALDYLEGLRSPGVASLLNDGREVLGRVRQGGTIPLFMTMGFVGEESGRKFCAVLRDITAFKKAEGELLAAKRAAEEANAQKSDLLAKISHEIRTPLNAIIGFAEVMLEERFGPVGNERYKDYLKDIHASGAHVMSLVNDLLDLAKIEAGRMELSFTSVNLNDLTAACFALLQPQAARQRIVMRTSFAVKLPAVVADERSVRQIVLNLVSNAIKFTDAGGQVILSTALTDRGEVAFRVRDTGIGMTDKEIESALEPFRQIATAHRRGGTGLGLPLTKALVEANRGALQILSHPNEGTLVEVLFPATRVLAE